MYILGQKSSFNLFNMTSGLLYLNSLDRFMSCIRGACLFLISLCFFYNFLNLIQTVWTLIRRRVLRRLIWVYTVCQCPFYGTLGTNGLTVNIYLKLIKSDSRLRTCETSKKNSVRLPCTSILSDLISLCCSPAEVGFKPWLVQNAQMI